MDENEITTVADTQAEKTADTADTGQTTPTTEELIQQLTARVAALEEIVGEEEYELRYSGEQTDELLDGGTAVFRAKTAAQIVSLVNRLYPLYMRWGVFHGEYEGQRRQRLTMDLQYTHRHDTLGGH